MDWMQECRDRTEKIRLLNLKDHLVKAQLTLNEVATQMSLRLEGKAKI